MPNPHNEAYRVTWLEKTAYKITLAVTKATSTSVPDTAPVSSIVCNKNDNHPDRSGVESPEDVRAFIYLNTGTFNMATSTMQVGTICSYQSNQALNGPENLSLFAW